MAYLLKHAARSDRIAEREWAVGQELKFNPFTSCIGVVAKITGCDKVIGIHLSLMDASGQWMSESDVNQLITLLHEWRYDAKSVHIIGATVSWYRGNTPQTQAAYRTLIRVLDEARELDRDDGTLAVRVVNGRMTLTYTDSKDGTAETFYFPEQQHEARQSSGLDPLDAPLDASLWYPRLRARSV